MLLDPGALEMWDVSCKN